MYDDFVASGNEVLIIKLVRSRSDIDDEECKFRPTYCHQIFGVREEIVGFKGLRIHLYYGACSLTTYLNFDYNEQIVGSENAPEDPLKKIKEILPPGTLSDIKKFTRHIYDEYKYRPFGSHLNTLRTSSHRVFMLFTCTAEEKDYIDFHNKLQVFILWFIESANLIDVTDLKWRIFLIYEQYTDHHHRPCHAVVGCATVYEFYSYPNGIRPRISQVLVLPPFQNQGLCSWLLRNIYTFYSAQPNTVEITVEDPSSQFQRVRDYVDCLSCIGAEEFSKEKLSTGFKREMIYHAKKFLINAKQTRRVYEILRLKMIDVNNEVEFKKYKGDIYNHIMEPIQRKNTMSFNKWQRLRKLAKCIKPKSHCTSTKRVESLMNDLLKSHQKVVDRLRKKEEEAAICSGQITEA